MTLHKAASTNTTADQPASPPPASPQPRTWWRHSRTARWLQQHLSDLHDAPRQGWRHMAPWIRNSLTATALLGVFYLVCLLTGGLLNWYLVASHGGTEQPLRLLATLTNPIHHYLDQHAHSLPLGDSAYATWQLAGIISGLLAATRSIAARIAWTTWGAATAAMVWQGTPDSGRPLATGLAVLAWALLSVLTLRGLTLRPQRTIHVQPTVRAEVVLPEPPAQHRNDPSGCFSMIAHRRS